MFQIIVGYFTEIQKIKEILYFDNYPEIYLLFSFAMVMFENVQCKNTFWRRAANSSLLKIDSYSIYIQ